MGSYQSNLNSSRILSSIECQHSTILNIPGAADGWKCSSKFASFSPIQICILFNIPFKASSICYTPQKLPCHLKRGHLKRKASIFPVIFVSFLACTYNLAKLSYFTNLDFTAIRGPISLPKRYHLVEIGHARSNGTGPWGQTELCPAVACRLVPNQHEDYPPGGHPSTLKSYMLHLIVTPKRKGKSSESNHQTSFFLGSKW